ncbi:L-2-hydroxyglutarate oxidase [Alteromonas oceanisediminis]|uniref:L-2-hydroxyglutarate oxidase n=1 Tax=Alteromonas oceanisediminis TaxID=2836180 RepID=UPI001BD9428C|nr:L-2-hydroxyglutarate oxidase [Alteromonas oceanisediminis]MBT0586490.1 L-2-hydroxyglutarate oxidase [Alteromonas oceanisediminis]
MQNNFDFIIIGGGIVGAATALTLSQRFPRKRITLLEKESDASLHQTGRNSGVIHAGVYYKPGSLKATLCRQGLDETIRFCQQHNIPYQQCGKLIVASDATDLTRMESLQAQCEANNLEPHYLNARVLSQRQPNIRGCGALHIQRSGITDYRAIVKQMLSLCVARGVILQFNSPVSHLHETSTGMQVSMNAETRSLSADFVINCAGIYADTLTRSQGLKPDFALLPFRGEYYRLASRCDHITNTLIYPVPDPDLPFLGVHITPMIGGYLTVGPNAVLALGKEAYQKHQFNFRDLAQMATFGGSWRLFSKHYRQGLAELKDSFSQRGYLRRVQRYCPSIQSRDLLPYRAGIRAQAVSLSGDLLHDFEFVQSPHALHIGNAPSPAATSALPIAKMIVDKIS